MKFTAQQIAGILEGEVEGDAHVEVSKLSKIEEGTEGSLTFLANPKYTPYIYTTQASITIVDDSFSAENQISTTLIRVPDAYKAFSKLLEYYNQVKMNKTGIEAPVFISDSATYGDQIYVGAFSYIGENVTLGDNAKIYPNVYIGDNVQIGDNVVVFAGAKNSLYYYDLSNYEIQILKGTRRSIGGQQNRTQTDNHRPEQVNVRNEPLHFAVGAGERTDVHTVQHRPRSQGSLGSVFLSGSD